MNTILNKIKRDLNVRFPVAAFAVIENGPDAFDYVVKVFFSSKNESIEAGKWKAEIYASRSNDDACYNAVIGCSYSVLDVTDHLCRYYWEQGEPFNIGSK
jgi:hypothetical protein